ncbi:MAG: methyltransferase domain-containing protein [Sphingobium sp.]
MDANEWTGPVGDVWAQEWRRTDRSFAGLSVALNRRIGEAMSNASLAVADIGCGAGATAIAAAEANPRAQIVGFDISPALVEIARTRASETGVTNAHFLAGPAEVALAGQGPFDLLVSRHGVMFFADPVAGFTALRSAARPKARLIFSCFRSPALNLWASEVVTAIFAAPPPPPPCYEPGPFAFADEAFVKATLAAAGWADAEAQPVDYDYVAGAGDDPVADAVAFFSRIGPAARALRAADPEDRAAMVERITAVCRAHRAGDTVTFPAAAWIWSARNPV